MRRAFRWFLSKLHRHDVGDGNGSTFFTRYDLLKTRWFSTYLHEFHRSDIDRCLHDHPWPFTTIILRGGYWEESLPAWTTLCRPFREALIDDLAVASNSPGSDRVLRERNWRRPGYVGRYPAEHAHRIELDPGRPKPWSLVFVGRKRRPWGFFTKAGWRAWSPGSPNPICETSS